MTADRPWMKFNPKRWRTDEALRMCGAAARGLWMELICIMHEAEPYGHLLVRGKQPHDRLLSVMVGVPLGELPSLLSELEENEVFSRNEDGIIFSRGMVRDEETHQQSSMFGKKGAAAKLRKEKAEKLASRGTLKGGPKPPHKGWLQLESEEEREEDKEEDKEPPLVPPTDLKPTKRPLPGDWEPEEFGEGTDCRSIVDGWSDQEAKHQVERFKAHHERDGNRYANWQAAWKTWVLNSVKFADRDEHRDRGRHQGSGGKSNDLVEIILAEHGFDEHGQPRKPKS
jgi:hypothetical protein